MTVLYLGEKDFIAIKTPRGSTSMLRNELVMIEGVRGAAVGTELLVRLVASGEQRVTSYPNVELRLDGKVQKEIDRAKEAHRPMWLLKRAPLEARKRYACQDAPRITVAAASA